MNALSTEELAETLAAHHAIWFRRNPTLPLVPTCLIFSEDGAQTSLPCGWSSDVGRELTLALLRATMIIENAIRYAIWFETWTRRGDVPDDYQNGDLARSPDRVEAIFTLVVEASGAQAVRLQKIVRGRNGGVRRLEPFDENPELWKGAGGALGDLLPPRVFN
jgi:hypothetical protein